MNTAAAAAPGTRRLGLSRVILVSAYWVALGYLWLPLGSQVLPVLIRNLVGDAHKGTAVALLEGVGTVISVFVQPVMGALSDRTNSRIGRRHPYIIAGTFGSCVFLALMTLGGGFWWLFGLYFLLQVSENSAQGPYQGLLPDVVPEAERSRASAFVGGGNLVGVLLGTIVVGNFMRMNRPDLAIISMIVVLVLATAVVTLFVRDRTRSAPGLKLDLREVVLGTFAVSPKQHADFLWLMVSRLFILVAIAGLQGFAFYYFKDVFYPGRGAALSSAASGATTDLLGIIIVFALFASYPAAALSHRVGRRPLIAASGVLGALGTVGMVLSPYRLLPLALTGPLGHALGVAPQLAQGLLFGLLVGVATGSFISVDWAYLCDVIPEDEAGRFLGFSNIATASSGIIARFIGGPIIDIFNSRGHILRQPGGYPVTFGVYVGFFIMGTIAVFRVRETRRRGVSLRGVVTR
ncbi:MAG: MFS transporter [Candidatus Dormibacteria bacterium]